MIGNYKDFISYKFKETNGIPKVIYRTGPYKLENLPSSIKKLYETDLQKNPEYDMFYFDDNDCDEFLILEYGVITFDIYSQLIPSAFRADYFRYHLLNKYGGVWMDFSMSTNEPLDFIIRDYKQVYVRDRIHTFPDSFAKISIYQGFLATVPNSEVLTLAIEMCRENILTKNPTESCLAVTGPILLGKAYRRLKVDGKSDFSLLSLGHINNDVYLCSYEYGLENIIVAHNRYVIFIKHPEHQTLLYRGKDHYGQMWNDKKIYKNE